MTFYTVTNTSQKTILTKNLKKARSFSDKLLGLMKASNESLWFETRYGIHTFGMRKTIDVLIADENYKVVKTGTIKPNRIFLYNPKYSRVLEFPKGTIRSSKTEVGDTLKITA